MEEKKKIQNKVNNNQKTSNNKTTKTKKTNQQTKKNNKTTNKKVTSTKTSNQTTPTKAKKTAVTASKSEEKVKKTVQTKIDEVKTSQKKIENQPKQEEKKPEKVEVKNEPIKEEITVEKKKTAKEKVELEPKVSKPEKDPEVDLEKTMIFDGTQRKNLEEVIDKLSEDNVVLKDKVIKRSAVNRNIIIILTVAIIGIIVGCIIYSIDYSKKANEAKNNNDILDVDKYNKIETTENKNGGSQSTSNENTQINYSNIKNISMDDFEVKLAEGENILTIISSETCFYCVTFEPVINNILAEQKQVIYRLNITNMNDDEINRLRNYYAFSSAPTLMSIKNGKIDNVTEGTLSSEEFSEWLKNNA